MDTELLIIDDESEIIIEVDTDVEVLEAAAQGPRGPQGPQGPQGIQGPAGDAGGALLVTARLSEFISEEAKAEARTNLGLATIDGGTFF